MASERFTMCEMGPQSTSAPFLYTLTGTWSGPRASVEPSPWIIFLTFPAFVYVHENAVVDPGQEEGGGAGASRTLAFSLATFEM